MINKEKISIIKNYSYIFLWTQLFPILIYILNGYKNIGVIEVVKNIKAGARICLIVYLVFWIISYILPKKIFKFGMLSLIAINLIANICDLFAYINFGTQINSDIFYTVLETNLGEGKEFLLTYFNERIIIIFIYIILILFLLYKIKLKKYFTSLIMLIAVIGIVFSFNLNGTDYTRKYVLATLGSSYKKYKKDAEEYKKFLNNLKDFDLKKEIKDLNTEESLYVMIIGESSSKFHSSIYGYYRNTTPELLRLKNNNELVVFNNVITPHSTTREALQEVLTLKSSEVNKNFYEVPSILDFFEATEFKTYWLSNQESYGIIGNVVASIASKAQHTKYTEEYTSDSRKFKKYDETLLPMLDKVLEEKTPKKFIVIHLMGNHMQYQERYPGKFNYFKDIDKNFNEWQIKKKDKVNDYDNSMLYVDYIISEIIKKVEKQDKKSYVLYFSDHGEEIWDTKDFMGHGENKINSCVSDIPFVLWMSDKYKLDNTKVENILKNVDRKYSTEDLPYTILDLSYLKWNNFDNKKSVINPNFKGKMRYHVNLNYDIQD